MRKRLKTRGKSDDITVNLGNDLQREERRQPEDDELGEHPKSRSWAHRVAVVEVGAAVDAVVAAAAVAALINQLLTGYCYVGFEAARCYVPDLSK
jgi:hypothetical protein